MNYKQVKKAILWSVLLGVTSFLGLSCILNNHENQESLNQNVSSSMKLDSTVINLKLSEELFTPINFKRIKPNHCIFRDNRIIVKVDQSASFLLFPFERITNIKRVQFDWKSEGLLNVEDAVHEASKQGDDAFIRVGLILKSKSDFIDLFGSPQWIRKAAEVLNHSADRVVFLLPGARNTPGRRWKNPFSKKVEMISIPSKEFESGWKNSEFQFESPQQTVGLMIMADGDNTESSFVSEIQNLMIEFSAETN